ncbi:hypothetical protein CDAR_67011 [Caerostris darwini]|uniref:Uncharacterized protein n=1 Tax=Caerostris darwini TaxID=1538125 RepID=A0AAV4QYB3_9ARAC|nr:hypothetical protein CDAR_67011 [Caerostris darwini]
MHNSTSGTTTHKNIRVTIYQPSPPPLYHGKRIADPLSNLKGGMELQQAIAEECCHPPLILRISLKYESPLNHVTVACLEKQSGRNINDPTHLNPWVGQQQGKGGALLL